MHKQKRFQLIRQTLSKRMVVTVPELVELLGVSAITVRRDINELADLEHLKKIHGGAEVLDIDTRPEQEKHAYDLNLQVNLPQKMAIAKKAVELCDGDESVIINGGTTTYQMVPFLTQLHLQVFTNSFPMASYLIDNSENRIQLPGGEVYRKQNIILSPFDNDTIQSYHASKMFTGAYTVNQNGILENDPRLIRSQIKLLKQSEQLIVMADSSKFATSKASLILCPLERVDVLITDDGADQKALEMCSDAGVEVLVVKPDY